MTLEEFNEFCGSLPAAAHVVQWGGSHVWKVGGKLFALGRWEDGEVRGITFKVSHIAFEVLRDMPGHFAGWPGKAGPVGPAPYLASRGFRWIQHHARPGLSDDELRNHIARSYEMVAAALPKKTRKELGLTGGA